MASCGYRCDINEQGGLFNNDDLKMPAVCEYSFSAVKRVYLCCETDCLWIKKLKDESIDELSISLDSMRIGA